MKSTNKLLVVVLALAIAVSGIVMTTLTTSAATEINPYEEVLLGSAATDYDKEGHTDADVNKKLTIETDPTHPNVGGVGNTFNGAWLKYDNVAFGDNGAAKVTIKYGSKATRMAEDAKAEIWVDGKSAAEGGTLVATVNLPVPEDRAADYVYGMTSSVDLATAVTGTKTMYVVLTGTTDTNDNEYIANLSTILFTEAEASEDNSNEGNEGENDKADAVEGMNAIIYRPELVAGDYKGAEGDGLLVEDSYGAQCSFNNMKQFDASIEGMLAKSFVRETVDATKVEVGNNDNYVMKWTGTLTAAESGTYTLIGRKIDNGFVMYVDGEKVYEYWGASHWFDGGSDRLVSDDGSFDVVAGESYDVEIYFLELGGGDALEIWATTTPDNTDSGANMNDVFTFDLTRETYWLKDGGHWQDYANDGLVGSPTGEANGGQCGDDTALFEESIDKLLSAFTVVDSKVVSSFKEPIEAYDGDTAYVIVYVGTLVPNQSGEYTFGANTIDNGFYLEIGEDMDNMQTAYEFWVGRRWNDDGSGNTYGQSITLEAGKEYYFAAAFLETNGGQALDLVASIDGGDRVSVDELFTFYALDTGDGEGEGSGDGNGNGAGDGSTSKPVTGDVASVAAILAAGVAALGALKLKKKAK